MLSLRMLLVLLIVSTISIVNADDKSECLDICKDKFVGNENEKAACAFGCDARKTLGKDLFGFETCNSECSKKYSNETDSSDDDSEEIKACKFACVLPYESRFSMTLDMSGDTPKWHIEQVTGSGAASSLLSNKDGGSSSLSDILLKPRVFNLNRPKAQSPGLLTNPFPTDVDSDSTENEKFFDNMIRRVLGEANRRMEQMASGGFQERPNGHGLIAFNGPEVGNDFEGQPIITEFDADRSYESKYQYRNHGTRGVMLTMALLMLIFAIFGIIMFFKRPRVEEYSRMRNNFRQQSTTHPMTVGELPAKKSMIAEDGSSWEQKEPKGDAPPAYDQVSVHKIPMANLEDK